MLGIGVFLTSCLVIDDFRKLTGTSVGDRVVGSASAALLASAIQVVMSVLLFFKVNAC